MTEENQIRPRDLDKVRERKPIYIEPKHIFWAVLSSLFLLAVAFVAGFVVGKTRASEVEVRKEVSEVSSRAMGVAQSIVSETGVRRLHRNGVRLASVLPLPPPRHGPDLSLQASMRREAVEVQENTVNIAPSYGETESPSTFPIPAVDSPAPGKDTGGQSDYKAVEAEAPKIRQDPKQNKLGQVSVSASNIGKPQLSLNPQSETYTIQVRSYRDRDMALKFQDTLREKGYSPRLETHMDEQGNEWFRVMLGRFDTISEAKDFAKSFNSKENESAIVVKAGAKR